MLVSETKASLRDENKRAINDYLRAKRENGHVRDQIRNLRAESFEPCKFKFSSALEIRPGRLAEEEEDEDDEEEEGDE